MINKGEVKCDLLWGKEFHEEDPFVAGGVGGVKCHRGAG